MGRVLWVPKQDRRWGDVHDLQGALADLERLLDQAEGSVASAEHARQWDVLHARVGQLRVRLAEVCTRWQAEAVPDEAFPFRVVVTGTFDK